MKKYLKFSGIVALVFALVAFILMMACKSIIHVDNSGTWYSGIAAIFAGGKASALGFEGDFDGKLAWTALIAWILILAAMVIILAGIILPLLKVKALDKFAGVLNLVAVCALVVGGILLFFTKPAFLGANDVDADNFKYWKLGGGFVVAGILAIIGGCFAILPAAFDFVGKKK